MAKNAAILLGTMAATGIGYAAGILLAPKSGSDMREQIKGKAKVAADKVNGRINQGKQKMETSADDARSKADEIKDMARKSGMPENISTHPAM